jgi:transcriptional regulator
MYDFPQYKESDREKIIAFMKDHPFVMLIGVDRKGRIVCTQIPVLIEEREGKLYILGHIARKLDHERALAENPNALIVFSSLNTYVSGSWYSGEPHVGSTWNYISIHARGELKWMSEKDLREFMRKFTLYFEKNNTQSTTIFDNLPTDYIERMIKGIIGFEMEVTELENVHKLSQNRDEKSYQDIIEKLEQQDASGKFIAERMKENESRLFRKS